MSHSMSRRAFALTVALTLAACGGSDGPPTVTSVVPLPDAFALAEGEVALTVFKPATLAFEPAAASFVDPVGQVLHPTLRNVGDRLATGVSLAVTFPLGGAGWLTAAPAAGGTLDLAAGAEVVLDLALDPTGLASGLHAAEVAPLADPEVNFSGNAYTVVVRVP